MTSTVPTTTPPRLVAKDQQRPPIYSSPMGSPPLVDTTKVQHRTKKVLSHGKTPSWEAFDPLLTSQAGTGVWGVENNKGSHPLKKEDSLLELSGPPKANIPPKRQSHKKTKSATTPTHKKSNSIEELRHIAQELAIAKPASFVAEQEELINTWQGSKRNIVKAPPVLTRHRKAKSLGTNDIFTLRIPQTRDDSSDDGLIRTSSSRSAPNTPENKSLRKKAPTTPERKSARQTKGLATPERKKRNSGSSFLTPTRRNNKEDNNNIPPPPEMPRLTPLHGFLTHKDNLSMRSSEQDPSHHQVEIPSSDDFLLHSRLCAVMDQYRVVDQNFDFGTLVNTSRMALQGFVASSKKGNNNKTAASGLDGLIPDHAPIVQSLLECSDDLILEGFFCSDSEKTTHDRIEAAVFNSQSLRQFVVVYRGTTDQQIKPVRNKHLRASPVPLIGDQPVGVHPAFRDAYLEGDTEQKIFALLDNLSEKYPFCDVVMTGHSFGGALATIAGLRYSSAREMMCVSCHAFGSPKVGNSEWRGLVNSQPNLKVMRLEHSTDACVLVPPDTNVYMHVGHTLQVQQKPDQRGNKGALPTGAPPPASGSSSPVAVTAYRFERNKPAHKNFLGLHKRDNKAHEIQAYVRSMEQFARLGQAWVKQYAGEDVGKGVRGTGNEKRQMV